MFRFYRKALLGSKYKKHNDNLYHRCLVENFNLLSPVNYAIGEVCAPEVNTYILLDVLVCSIAVYFYELCGILTSP